MNHQINIDEAIAIAMAIILMLLNMINNTIQI